VKILDIREISVPLKTQMRNAVFDFSEMTTSVVAVKTDVLVDAEPVIGYAFNSTGRYACGEVMRTRMIPRLLKASPDSLLDPASGLIDPALALACMTRREKPGGHTERSIAVGTIECAVWDALAKVKRVPLHTLLAERFNGGKQVDKVPCYVGGGWYAQDKGLSDLSDEIKMRLQEGYTHMKIKVGGVSLADDLKRIETSIAILGDSEHLAVDANAGLDHKRTWEYANALAPFGLRWFEEPTDPLDFKLLFELSTHYAPAIATGENLFSTQDIQNLLRYSGLRAGKDILQVDIPQSYGITQFTKTLQVLRDHGWSSQQVFPHGGNMMTLAIVAGLDLGGCEAYPGVFGVFAGFNDDAQIENGMIKLSDRPGMGFEGQNELYELMRHIF